MWRVPVWIMGHLVSVALCVFDLEARDTYCNTASHETLGTNIGP